VATNYPSGTDVFNEPSAPEFTPLDSAGGSSTRNHVEHHRDLGDAVEALQTHASQRNHDHSGNSTDPNSGPRLRQANTHQDVDTDVANTAIHHTLGTGQYQAAPGNHNHVYNTLLGTPLQSCLSTARPPNPSSGMLIYETDTRRIRVWDSFVANQLTTGLNSVENFNQGVNNLNLGLNRWSQVYYSIGRAVPEYDYPWFDELVHQGIMAIPDGQTASWIDGGNFTEQCVARRIYPADAVTQSDDQVLSFKTGSTVIEDGDSNPLLRIEGATNDFYLRMSAPPPGSLESQSYWHFRLGYNYIKVFATTTGRSGEFFLGRIDNVTTNLPNMEWRIELQNRTLRFYRLGELLGSITDSRALTSKGEAFRGWGIGMQAGYRVFGQTTPANLDWVRIADLALYQTIYRWTLLPAASVPNCRLRQITAQKLTHTGTILSWGKVEEDNFGFFNPATPTLITMTEPGLYQVDVALQWDPQSCPDVASAVLMLNGSETDIREQRFIRGNDHTPGFSQTVSMSSKIRVAVGDTLSIKAKYAAKSDLLSQIFSYFDGTSKVSSRIDITYVAP